MHEADLYNENCFITLTFSKEHLPADYSISVRDWQLFMKKLRFHYSNKIRFYMCGEYGDLNLRPHYHAILFNHDFAEKVLYKEDRGNKLYTSIHLSKIWPYGLATLGDVTFESAAYVARYVMKKITGEPSVAHYTRVHPDTKKIVQVKPEFTLMSRRPGIAAPWLERFKSDVYPSDFIIARNMKMAPPRYYDKSLTEEELEKLKRRRKKDGLRNKVHQTPERRRVRSVVRDSRIKYLQRNLKDHDQ